MTRGVINAHAYQLLVYKNPKVGLKPPHLVSFLTNCWFGLPQVQILGGHPFSPALTCYREFARAVNGANRMGLQLCIMTRQMTWASAFASSYCSTRPPTRLRYATLLVSWNPQLPCGNSNGTLSPAAISPGQNAVH